MKTKILFFLFVFSSLISISCLWDNDTIEMEKQEFPEVYDLLTGNFIRHSKEYYQWKIQDREQKLKEEPNNFQLYDDLAVAYSKLHQDKKAIEIMREKENLAPGKYETYANLGTFYLHDGQLKKGIEFINKAIEINPEAHFGREVYQKYLAEYLVEKGYDSGLKLPICKEFERDRAAKDFYAFLKKKQGKDLSLEELKKAIKGISGMMKFGNWDSPVLAEVLGDLLFYGASDWNKEEAYRNLAVLAYHRAKMKAKNDESKSKYEQRIRIVSSILRGEYRAYKKLSLRFEQDLIQADSNFQKIRKNEMQWIEEGIDVDEKFAEVYYGIKAKPKPQKSREKSEENLTDANIESKEPKGVLIYNILIGLLIAGFFIVIVFLIRKNMK